MLSAIIPTRNAERHLVPVLSALVDGVTCGLLKDVVLVDNGSTDETATIADAAGCVFLDGGTDEGQSLRQAVARARGRWLIFLPSSSLLAEGWARDVSGFIETAERLDRGARMAATFRLAVDGYGFVPRFTEAVAATRLALLGRPEPGQGLLLSRACYERLGGHQPGPQAHRRLVRRIGRHNLHTLHTHVMTASH